VSRTEAEYSELERWVRLRIAGPKLLDAMRLMRFAVLTETDPAVLVQKLVVLSEAGLQGTEDI
jgi:hypothetical protein